MILSSFLVGFFAVDPLIGFAEWTDSLLNVLHKVKDLALLVVTGMETDRAQFTHFSQGLVKR